MVGGRGEGLERGRGGTAAAPSSSSQHTEQTGTRSRRNGRGTDPTQASQISLYAPFLAPLWALFSLLWKLLAPCGPFLALCGPICEVSFVVSERSDDFFN